MAKGRTKICRERAWSEGKAQPRAEKRKRGSMWKECGTYPSPPVGTTPSHPYGDARSPSDNLPPTTPASRKLNSSLQRICR